MTSPAHPDRQGTREELAASVTDGDKERAMRVMAWDPLTYAEFAKVAAVDYAHPDDRDALELVDAIAQALADERERARAPFLRVAEYFAAKPYGLWSGREIAARIRVALGQQP